MWSMLQIMMTNVSMMQEAEEGMRAHGVITGIHEYGIFVGFYNDCSGLAPLDELALDPGQRPSDVYSIGQVSQRPLCGMAVRRMTKVPWVCTALVRCVSGDDACGGLTIMRLQQ